MRTSESVKAVLDGLNQLLSFNALLRCRLTWQHQEERKKYLKKSWKRQDSNLGRMLPLCYADLPNEFIL